MTEHIYHEFESQCILVTGAASGIGKAIALAFANAGGQVIALDIDQDSLKNLSDMSKSIHPIVCDLTKHEQVIETVQSALDKFGPISVLINNAGVDRRIEFHKHSSEDFRWMFAVNLEHYFLLSQLLAKGMRQLGHGAIINLSSTAWMKLAKDMIAYHSMKSGIIGLTRGLARDLGEDFIRVNALAPGRVYTERAAAEVDQNWIEETKTLQCIPKLVLPSDIAETALWLASDRARMITGQTIIIDGGVV